MIKTFDTTLSSIGKSKKIKEEKKMELKGKNVQTKTTNNQNVNSMNINQGNEKKSNQSTLSSPSESAFTNSQCNLISPTNSPTNTSTNNVHLENVNQSLNLSNSTSSSSSSSSHSNFKLEFNETILTNTTNYLNQINSASNQSVNSSLNQSLTNQSNCLPLNNDLPTFNNFNNNTIDLENNPHLLNKSTNDTINTTNQINFSPQSNYFNQQTSDDQLANFDTFNSTTQSTNLSTIKSNNNNNNFTIKETCATCTNQIVDRYLLKVNGNSYHEKCLICCCCGIILNNVCYQKNSKHYCKQDYLRLFFRKCDACNDVILPTELVMKIYTDGEIVFHLKCFACHSCKLPLKTGDHFSFNNGLLFCKQHLLTDLVKLDNSNKSDQLLSTINSSTLANICNQQLPINTLNTSQLNQSIHLQQQRGLCNLAQDNLQTNQNLNNLIICSSNNQFKQNGELSSKEISKESFVRNRSDNRRGPKRPRTILTTAQRRAFKNSFELSQKPCRKVREGLAKETGLSVRIVQVWFQNQARRRVEGKLFQSSNLNNGLNSQSDLYNPNRQTMIKDDDDIKMKNLHMNQNLSHLQTSTSYSNEESQMTGDSDDEDFERYQFVNSPNDSSYYSPSTHSYSKSVNCNDDSDLEENLVDDENCINNLISNNNKNSKTTCNKKNTSNSQNPNSASNSSNFEFSNTNLFPVQTNVNFSNAISDSPIGVAVAQAITSNDILTNNCSTPLSNKSNANTLQTTAINNNLSNSNEVEFTNNQCNFEFSNTNSESLSLLEINRLINKLN